MLALPLAVVAAVAMLKVPPDERVAIRCQANSRQTAALPYVAGT